MTDLALSSAVSSLLLLEKQMNVTSSNISNANTAGYTAETEQVGAQVTNGIGSGVLDLGTTSNVDHYLQAQVITANSVSTQASTYNQYYQSLQQAMGQITSTDTGGNDISSQIATVQTSFAAFAATPQNTSLGNSAIGALDDLTSNLRSTSHQIQSLRTQADQQISDTVSDVNTQLDTINDLNTQIATAQASGQSTAALNDKRATALQSLSADIGIGYYTSQQGALQIYTTSGQPLLTGNQVNHLSHSPVSISGTMSYPGGGIGPITVGNTDLTTLVSSGKLASLIQQRDTELPDAQNSLDYLAQQMASGLNAVSNLGSASPPPSSLTSAAPATFLDSSSPDGTTVVTPSVASAGPPATQDLTTRFALVDSSGQVQAYQDIDLSGDTSVGQIVTSINTAFGANVASLNGAGQLQLQAPPAGTTVNSGTAGSETPVTLGSSTGIAVSTLQGTLNGTDFSSFFHLNDLVTFTGNSISASSISVNPAMLKNSSLVPVGTLNNALPTAPATSLLVPFSGVGAGDGSTAQALSAALLNGNNVFTANTATGTVNFSNPANGPNAVGSFTINGGGNPVTISVAATDSLATIAANINAAAGTSGVTAKVVGNGTYQLQISSGGSSLSFSNVTGNVLSGLGISSSPSGHLGAATTTYGGFASNLISDIASRASTAQSVATEKTTTLTALQTTFSNQSGVNVDQQTAELSTLQNLYSASARVITTVNAMFSALLTAVQ